MSADPLPKNWIEAVPAVLFGFYGFAFAFEAVVAMNEGHMNLAVLDTVGCILLVAFALIWWKHRNWLPPKLVSTAIALVTDARWIIGIASVLLLVSSLSPFIEQRRWPFAFFSPEVTQEQPGQRPAATPTAIRFLFGNSQTPPTLVQAKNVKWQSYNYDESTITNATTALGTSTILGGQCPFGSTPVNSILGQCLMTLKHLILLLTFDRPVTYKKIRIEAQGGGSFPKWEKRLMTDSYAIIWFDGYPSGVVLDIEAVD